MEAQVRLNSLSKLGMLWTAARLSWGTVALTTVVQGWLVAAQKTKLFYTVVLVRLYESPSLRNMLLQLVFVSFFVTLLLLIFLFVCTVFAIVYTLVVIMCFFVTYVSLYLTALTCI